MPAWSTASVSAIFQVSSSCAAGMVKFNYFNSCKTKKMVNNSMLSPLSLWLGMLPWKCNRLQINRYPV